MKLKNLIRLALLPCCLFAVSNLYSQETEVVLPEDEENEEEDIISLSPFVVLGSEDTGYSATSTLAGSKIKTNIRDLSASISIITEAFMKDTNSTQLSDVLLYQGNTEVSGLTGNFSGSQGFGAGTVIGELARDNNTGGITRVRGLADADLTRDFFITLIPFDTFNSDRVTVSRGANSVLFGLGSPGGVVNNNLLKAQMRDYGRLKYRYEQYGSHRVEVRYNKEIIKDKLSVVIAAMRNDEGFEQKEAFADEQRIYANVLWEPIKSFRVRLGWEKGDAMSAKPRTLPPADLISVWFDVGKPILTDPLQAGIWRSGTTTLQGVDYPNSRLSQIIGGTAGPTLMWLDPNSSEPSNPSYRTFLPASDVDDSLPSGNINRHMVGLRPENVIRRLEGIDPDGTPLFPGSGGFYDQNTGPQILDRSIYDYREHLLDGGTSTQFSNFNDIVFSVEKTFFNDRMGIEFAYHDESFDEGQLNQLRGDPAGEALILDFNTFLGTTEPTLGGEVIPNPGFGQIVVASRAENGISFNRRDSWRITGFAELRASDIFSEDSFLEKLLGRLEFTGVYQRRNSSGYQLFSRDTPTISDVVDNLNPGGTAAQINVNAFRIGQYHVLAAPGLPAGTLITDLNSLDDLRGADIQPVNGSQVVPDSFNFVLWNMAENMYQEQVLGLNTILDNNGVPATFFASKSRQEIESTVLNGIFYFWDEMVVFQGAWRKDNQQSWSSSAPSLSEFTRRENLNDPNFLIDSSAAPNSVFDSENTTWGIVVHTPNFIKERLPAGLEFDFHYGKAQNFSPTSGRVDSLNRPIAAVTGSTEEVGFTVVALNQKLIANVNWFETGVLNNSIQNGAIAAPEGIMLNLARQFDIPENAGFTEAEVRAVLPSQAVIDLHGVIFDFANGEATSSPNPSRVGTQDFVSKGVEIEILFNPTRNWTNLIKITRQQTVTDNTYSAVEEFFTDFVKPNWIDSSLAQAYVIDPITLETLAERAQSLIGDNLTRAQSQDGSPSIEQREWRFTATSRYEFPNLFQNSDWISHFALGGSLRHEGKVGVGFPVIQNEFGDTVFDIDNPYFGGKETYADIFVSWDTKIFGRNTSFQVYVRDITNHKGLVPVYANPDNSRTFRITEGRLFSLSASINF